MMLIYKVVNFIILSDVSYSRHIYPNSRFRKEVDREISKMKLSLSAWVPLQGLPSLQ